MKKINLKRPLKKPMDNSKKRGYNVSSNPVCHSKEVVAQMASQSKTVKGTLSEDRGTWVVRARVFNPLTGKNEQRSKSTGLKVKDRTKRKAEQMLKEIVAEWETEANREPNNDVFRGDTLFSEYINGWLDNKDLMVRANTAKSYRDYATVHILPALGKYPVNQITWRTLQKFCDTMLKNHTKSTVKKFFIVIRGSLDDALRDEAILTNPERLVRWPKAERVEKARALTPDEVGRLLKAAEQAGEPMRAAITLALFYGLRRSEACGLRWTDIDFTKGTMHVQHTVTQNGTVLLDDDHTKTRGSNRTLVLIDQTIPYLKQLRAEQAKAGLLMDKVVAWPDGKPLRPDGITRMFSTILRNNGIEKARYHDLRHTAATMLANAGVPPKQLQAFLGHDDIEMTLGVYVHTSENAAADTSERMGEAMGKIIFGEICSEFCSESPKLVKLG